jgi:hypothetical protein
LIHAECRSLPTGDSRDSRIKSPAGSAAKSSRAGVCDYEGVENRESVLIGL